MRRIPAYLAAAAVVLLPTLGGAQDEAEEGGGFLEGLIERNLSAAGREVRVTGFAGALSSRATLDELTIADDAGVWLTLRNAELDWARAALLDGRLEIDALTAEELIVARRPVAPTEAEGIALPPAAAQGFSLPELPVAIRIGALSIARAELGADVLGQAAVLALEGDAALADGAGRARLDIARLDAAGGRIALSGAFDNAARQLGLELAAEEPAGGILAALIDLPGTPALDLDIAGDGPLSDFAADLRLATDGVERLAGQLTLREAADQPGATGFELDVAGDVAPLVAPEYRDFFGAAVAVNAAGTRRADGATLLDALRIETAHLALSGSAEIAADGLPERFRLTGGIADAGGAPVRLPFAGSATRIGQAAIDLAFDAAAGDRWTGAFTVSGFERPDIAARDLQLTGDGRIRREPGANRVSASLDMTAAGIRFAEPGLSEAIGDRLDGRAEIDWESGTPIRVLLLQLGGRGLSLLASGEIDGLDSALRLSGEAEARVADLGAFAPLAGQPLDGAAEVDVRGSGAVLGGDFDVEVSGRTEDLALGVARLDPLLRGRGRLALEARRDTGGTVVDRLSIATGRAEIEGSARFTGSEGALTLDATLADLSDVLPGAGGPGALTLDAADPEGDGTWQARLSGEGPGAAVVSAEGEVRGLDATPVFEGRAEAGADDLSAFAQAAGRAIGGAAEARFEGVAALDGTGFDGTLVASTRNLRTGLAEADRLLAGEGRLSAEAALADGALRIDRLEARTPQATATASGRLAPGAGRLSYDLRLADLGLFLPDFPGPVTASGTLGRLARGGFDIALDARGAGGVVLRADGTASDDLRRFAMSLSGQLPAAALNRVIAPAAAQGMLAFDLGLDGPPTLSALSGRVSTGDGRLLLPEQNLAFSNLAARATLSGGQATLSATGQVDGGGRVTVDGPVSLSPPFGADLSITAVDVMLRDPMLYETRASGRLTLRGPLAGGALAAGRITLAETNIRVPETGLSGSEPIPEITHVGPSAEVLRTRDRAGLSGGGDAARGAGGPVYGLDVEVAAPNRIFVRGRGLDAEFGGAIRLRGTTSDVVPAGQFSLVRGRLDILSKRLELDEAEFTLRGALVPWLRLVARNEADDATLYVSLTGPADSPEIRFYAEPELPEDEVLARLLFGKGIENLSPLQAAQLAAAVARLAGRGGLDLIGGLRRSFGLDDLDVRQTEEGGAAVTAGRYITENVYTDVTVGENTGEVTLNLDITPNITARGSADTEGETSLGIFFERDY